MMRVVRSRPLVRVLLGRSPLEPGSTFELDVVLTSRSETPTSGVDVVFTSEVYVAIPEGKSFRTRHQDLARDQRFRWTPGTLAKGEHRQRFQFVLPPAVPPSYDAARGWCRVSYVVDVHVAIPYWIDRFVQFALPVAAPPRMPGASSATITATHPRGQVAGELYVEAALDVTQLVPGEELRGEISFANTSTKRIRRVELAFVAAEAIREPTGAHNVIARYAATLVSGAPPEGETLPFRIALPANIWPSFHAGMFQLRWSFEVRVDVVLGNDVVLTVPIEVVRPPPGVELPPRSHRMLPVGRQRLARLWAIVAQRVGMSYDESEGMTASRGPVSLVLAREVFQGTLGIIANYRYPHLGLDVRLGERGFFDALARRRYTNRAALDRFTVLGREAPQLDAFFDDELAAWLAALERIELDDDGARVHVAGTASSAAALEAVARSSLHLLDLLARAVARVPAPAAMAPFETAWRDFAAQVGGRFEPGRVWIHDASLAGFRFEMGTVFEPDNPNPIGTLVRVPIEPPLDRAPSVEDAALSANARAALGELVASEDFHAAADEMGIFVRGPTPNPSALLPRIEAMVAVLRALRGAIAAGPFR